MNRATFSRWLTTGVVGLGTILTVAGTISPAQAEGRRHPGIFRRPGNGGYGGYGGPGNGNNGNNGVGTLRRAANASWSEIDRRPDFSTNSRPGFYVWRQGDDVYVVSNDANRTRRSHFTGIVTIQGGTLSNPGGYRTEGRDRWQQVSPSRLRFNFTTDNGLDGIKFRVNGGNRIVMNLEEGGTRVDRFYLGQYKVQTILDPLIIAK